MSTEAVIPTRVEAHLDPQLSRWLWLVKWLLAIPHFVVLAFLWAAFFVLSVGAFFAILLTGRYPRSIFEFNVGVLRWSWRVAYYAYGALGTDRYPPFALAEVEDYPAHLDIAYPERLSRGLVLVKWWLLAIPHYLIVGVLMGGTWIAWREESWAGPGLIGLLVLIAAIALAATGNYPRGLFDLILGCNRWVLRVAAYAGLMTDEYPPFRLDLGGSEPTGTLAVPPGTAVSGSSAGWSGGRVLAVVSGALLILGATGVLAGGAFALWADRTQRDAAGFLSTPAEELATSSYAIVARDIQLGEADGTDWILPQAVLGDARVRAAALDDDEVFVGVARARAAARYLRGVGHASVEGFRHDLLVARRGGAPAGAPTKERFWIASSAGAGTQAIEWPVAEGSWTVVVMNADGSKGVSVRADAGARVPILPWVAGGLLVAGVVLLLLGGALVLGAIHRAAGRRPTAP